MGSDSQSISTMLDLKDFFVETLSKRIEILEQALAGEIVPGSEAEAAVRHVAHGIRGAGGTYGFPELSALAETVDLAPAAALRPRAYALLEELRRLTRTALPDQASVLLIEGSDDDAQTLSEALRSPGRAVRRVRTAEEATAAIQEEAFQLIVLDIVLPDLDGRSLLLRLQEQLRTASVPVIVVTGNDHSGIQAECYQLGASQVFVKPVDSGVLSAAALATIERATHTNRISTLDPLTGLPNRAGFHEMLQRSVSICARSHEQLSIAVLDLDRFKSINDTHGHLVGDEVLQRVAVVMQERTRKSDYIARWGGEEFVGLFYGSGTAGATIALERLREAVKNERFKTADGAEFGVSFSAGVVELALDGPPSEAIAEADRLLYRAKLAGRDRIVSHETVVAVPRQNVLLAEDDELVAVAVTQILQQQGFDVVHFSNSEEVLQAVENSDIDVGILDVNMPGMDGFELLAKMRHLPNCQTTPIIMLTACGDEKDVVRGFELGADDYVIKPFSPPELVARVHRLTRSR